MIELNSSSLSDKFSLPSHHPRKPRLIYRDRLDEDSFSLGCCLNDQALLLLALVAFYWSPGAAKSLQLLNSLRELSPMVVWDFLPRAQNKRESMEHSSDLRRRRQSAFHSLCSALPRTLLGRCLITLVRFAQVNSRYPCLVTINYSEEKMQLRDQPLRSTQTVLQRNLYFIQFFLYPPKNSMHQTTDLKMRIAILNSPSSESHAHNIRKMTNRTRREKKQPL